MTSLTVAMLQRPLMRCCAIRAFPMRVVRESPAAPARSARRSAGARATPRPVWPISHPLPSPQFDHGREAGGSALRAKTDRINVSPIPRFTPTGEKQGISNRGTDAPWLKMPRDADNLGDASLVHQFTKLGDDMTLLSLYDADRGTDPVYWGGCRLRPDLQWVRERVSAVWV